MCQELIRFAASIPPAKVRFCLETGLHGRVSAERHRVHNRPCSSSAGPQTVQNSSHWNGRNDPMHRNRKHRMHNRPYQVPWVPKPCGTWSNTHTTTEGAMGSPRWTLFLVFPSGTLYRNRMAPKKRFSGQLIDTCDRCGIGFRS